MSEYLQGFENLLFKNTKEITVQTDEVKQHVERLMLGMKKVRNMLDYIMSYTKSGFNLEYKDRLIEQVHSATIRLHGILSGFKIIDNYFDNPNYSPSYPTLEISSNMEDEVKRFLALVYTFHLHLPVEITLKNVEDNGFDFNIQLKNNYLSTIFRDILIPAFNFAYKRMSYYLSKYNIKSEVEAFILD